MPGQRGCGAHPRQGCETGGAKPGPNPTDRAKPGTHDHLVVDGQGTPLAALSTAANVNEGTMLERLIDAIPPLKQPHGRPGRPRRRPAKLHADLGFASDGKRAALRHRGIAPQIARRGIESRQRLGRDRWVVEHDCAWLHRNRRLLVRYARDAALPDAFLHLGCALICWQALQRQR